MQKVTEILEYLQQGKVFTSTADTTMEKQTLLAEIKRLRQILENLSRALQTIKSSETFISISNISDYDVYFLNIRQQLQEQLNQLQNG